jgi:SAM-dependent methyltransferase
MFSRTLKKKLRLRTLHRVLGDLTGQTCLLVTCGDNNGAINYLLRELGGRWYWADCETVSLAEMRALLGDDVQHVDPRRLPYSDGQFDCVVTIDVHEHVREPESFMQEIRRVLRPGGRAIVTVPGGDPRRLANRLKAVMGMHRQEYGHLRDGFSVGELEALMRSSRLEPRRAVTFSRFFTELIELAINYAYVKKLSKAGSAAVPTGTIAPATAAQLQSVGTSYRLYAAVYPLVWLFTQLDRLLFFRPGYVVLVEGAREAG